MITQSLVEILAWIAHTKNFYNQFTKFFTSTKSAGAYRSTPNSRLIADPWNAEMAPVKKSKKAADGINSRLALVMKSGKGENIAISVRVCLQYWRTAKQSPLDTSRPSRFFDQAKQSLLSSPETHLLSARVNSSIMLCSESAMFTTSLVITWVCSYFVLVEEAYLHYTQRPYHSVCEGSAQRKSPSDFGGYIHFAYFSSFLQIELGTACGKLFRCSVMSILDAGDSDILSGNVA